MGECIIVNLLSMNISITHLRMLCPEVSPEVNMRDEVRTRSVVVASWCSAYVKSTRGTSTTTSTKLVTRSSTKVEFSSTIQPGQIEEEYKYVETAGNGISVGRGRCNYSS